MPTLKQYRDLTIILLLDIISFIWIITTSLTSYILNYIPYILLTLFLPGYSLFAALKPTLYRMGVLPRGILTVTLSVAVTIATYITLQFYPITSLFYSLAGITIIFTLIGFIRRKKSDTPQKTPISHPEEAEVEELHIPPELDEDIAIKVENVSMKFNLSQEKVDNLKEYVIKFIKRELFYQEFWALKHISFYVKKGEKLGIVGLNGAGKSTLLKLISGVMKPTEGNIKVNGGVVPLIELGGGFDANYTGRENIFLRGALLGYSKEFMESKFDEILEFSELKEFIDVPVKNYSSGMVARLGFSISTIVHPQILILDEVLSVGDAKFRKKSRDRMNSFLNEDVTVLLVSHSAVQIKDICDRAIWLENGRLVMEGSAEEVTDKFTESIQGGK